MISTKLYSLVLITLFGLIVFNSLEYAACEDDGVAKAEEVTKEEGAKAEEVKDDGHKCEGDNCTTCTDNSKAEKEKDDSNTCTTKTPDKKKKVINVRMEPNGAVIDIQTGKVINMTYEGRARREAEEAKQKEIAINTLETETRKECINILKKFNFNGLMTHDAFEVDFKNTEPNDNDKENDTAQNYKMHIDYLVTKVISTESDLLDYYCNKIDPLFRIGFNGDYNDDMELEERMQNGVKKPKAKIIEDDHQKYLDFLLLPDVYDYVSELRNNGIKRTNLIFQCALSNNWFKSHVAPTSKDCEEDKKGLGYDGSLVNDTKAVADRENEKKELPEYAMFVKFLTTNKASGVNKDFVILYCEIIDALRANGFTGKKEDVDHKVADEKLNAELVNGYTHFIKLPGKSDGEDDLRFKYTLFRISVNTV